MTPTFLVSSAFWVVIDGLSRQAFQDLGVEVAAFTGSFAALQGTGIQISPSFAHFNLAAALARDLETAANWELMSRGPRPCAPEIALPSFQWAKVASLVTSSPL